MTKRTYMRKKQHRRGRVGKDRSALQGLAGYSGHSDEGTKGLKIRAARELSRTNKKKTSKPPKTYNSRDSLVVTHPTTNLPACGLSTAERTGSPVLHTLWSYVLD
ncbi:hypothetical protein N7448_003906 [Penicillium atrosanguineum]|nr:hypothetical protein N7448_003906 [Penicillium atrosanguineum]